MTQSESPSHLDIYYRGYNHWSFHEVHKPTDKYSWIGKTRNIISQWFALFGIFKQKFQMWVSFNSNKSSSYCAAGSLLNKIKGLRSAYTVATFEESVTPGGAANKTLSGFL